MLTVDKATAFLIRGDDKIDIDEHKKKRNL
jgi:hypothetical protein